ncbi:MAG: indole acetimide hydrolase [Corynebacteriales bacterium]|nr:indole acetimide hydrolase [Mycobacteriales bacterium]
MSKPHDDFIQLLTNARKLQETHGAFVEIAESVDARTVIADQVLASVPFAVKDNIHTAGFGCGAGHPALSGSRPFVEASVVRRLRDAGAVPIGTTNMHELAFGITSNNGHFGAVRNPFDPSRVAGGSSGGSAVAVAAGVVPFALGTDTGGSMRVPASFCGVVGLRPSIGRYPADGVIPLSRTRDTIGVFGRSVTDVQTVDSVITGEYSALTTPLDIRKLRVGVPNSFFEDLAPDVAQTSELWLTILRDAGAILVELDTSDLHAMDAECSFTIVLYEIVRDLAAYLEEHDQSLGGLRIEDLVKSSGSPDVANLLTQALAGSISKKDYIEALRTRDRMRARYADIFSSQVDVLTYPTVRVLPPEIGEDSTIHHNGREVPVFPTIVANTGPGSIAGVPSISLPGLNSVHGLPIGMSIEAAAGTDRYLLNVARAIERVTDFLSKFGRK